MELWPVKDTVEENIISMIKCDNFSSLESMLIRGKLDPVTLLIESCKYDSFRCVLMLKMAYERCGIFTWRRHSKVWDNISVEVFNEALITAVISGSLRCIGFIKEKATNTARAVIVAIASGRVESAKALGYKIYPLTATTLQGTVRDSLEVVLTIMRNSTTGQDVEKWSFLFHDERLLDELVELVGSSDETIKKAFHKQRRLYSSAPGTITVGQRPSSLSKSM